MSSEYPDYHTYSPQIYLVSEEGLGDIDFNGFIDAITKAVAEEDNISNYKNQIKDSKAQIKKYQKPI